MLALISGDSCVYSFQHGLIVEVTKYYVANFVQHHCVGVSLSMLTRFCFYKQLWKCFERSMAECGTEAKDAAHNEYF